MHSKLLGAFAAALVGAGLVTAANAQSPVTYKFGTLAPEGSSWLNKWYEVVKEVEKTSPTPVKIVTYPGGVMGDEPDMVRKLKFGQLHVAGLTVSGIAQLVPEVLVLNLPFLFRNYEEVDYVVAHLFPRFQEYAAKRGMWLMGMLDQGMIEAFSKKPLKTADEFIAQRVWIWNADPMAVKLAEALGINGVMLAVPEVLTSLQTGLVDTMFSSTTALVALQWYTQMKYYYRIRLRYDPAVILTTTKAIEMLPKDKIEPYKAVVRAAADKYLKPFLLELREEEKRLGDMLIKEQGYIEPNWNEADIAPMREKAIKVWDKMAGEYFPVELLAEVKALLAEYRAQHPAAK